MLGSVLDYAVVALYFAVMIGAGYWGLRRARSADDYLVAGRRLGPAMYLGTLSAVVLGASTIGGVSLLTRPAGVVQGSAGPRRRRTIPGKLGAQGSGGRDARN